MKRPGTHHVGVEGMQKCTEKQFFLPLPFGTKKHRLMASNEHPPLPCQECPLLNLAN